MNKFEYPHQKFLSKNNIDVQKLPSLLRKRIIGFEEMQEDVEHLIDEDQVTMEATLQKLSYEIEEELEEEFEEQLENNEPEEEEEKTAEEVGEEPAKIEEAEEIKASQETESSAQAEPLTSKEPEPEPKAEIVKEDNPEHLLDKLYRLGKTKLRKGDFKVIGLEQPESKVLYIGNFCIRKGKYDACYTLELKK